MPAKLRLSGLLAEGRLGRDEVEPAWIAGVDASVDGLRHRTNNIDISITCGRCRRSGECVLRLRLVTAGSGGPGHRPSSLKHLSFLAFSRGEPRRRPGTATSYFIVSIDDLEIK